MTVIVVSLCLSQAMWPRGTSPVQVSSPFSRPSCVTQTVPATTQLICSPRVQLKTPGHPGQNTMQRGTLSSHNFVVLYSAFPDAQSTLHSKGGYSTHLSLFVLIQHSPEPELLCFCGQVIYHNWMMLWF